MKLQHKEQSLRYEVRKLYRAERDNDLRVLVDCYIPLPDSMNDEGWTMQAAYQADPHMEKSKAALFAAMDRGTIQMTDGMCHIRVGAKLAECVNPDAPTRQEIKEICQAVVKQYAALLTRDLEFCYQFTGLSEEVR